jgi:thymidylate synthase
MGIAADIIWKECLIDLMQYGKEVKPRGMKVKEVVGFGYDIDMRDPIITLESRKMNYAFMFGEAAWICSGSNWLEDLTVYMKRYEDFSDDRVFLNGAYGVKVVEQATYVTETLVKDPDSRQAVMTIWRERPAPSKDIPCTVSMQFFIRDNKLHMIVNMRSQDAVLGLSYDIFTFSSVANLIRLMLLQRGVKVDIGILSVFVGSFHIYEQHFDKVNEWVSDATPNIEFTEVTTDWDNLLKADLSPRSYTKLLKGLADDHLRRP